jgi:hypothetical protein
MAISLLETVRAGENVAAAIVDQRSNKVFEPIPCCDLGHASLCLLDANSAVQSDTAIKRQALRSEDNGPAAGSGLRSPVVQRTPGKIINPGPSTIEESIELFASVPSLLQAHRSIGTHDLLLRNRIGILARTMTLSIYVTLREHEIGVRAYVLDFFKFLTLFSPASGKKASWSRATRLQR